MIEIKNIKKSFTKFNEKKQKITFYADNDISFEVHEGEVVGLAQMELVKLLYLE